MANAAIQAQKDQALADMERWEDDWDARREFYVAFRDSPEGVQFGVFEQGQFGQNEPTLRRLPNLLKSCCVWGHFFHVGFMRYLVEEDPYTDAELVGIAGETNDAKQLAKFIDDLHTSTPRNVISRIADGLPQNQRLAFWNAILQISNAVAPPPPPPPVHIDLSTLPFGAPLVVRQSHLNSGLVNSITRDQFVQDQDVVRIVAHPEQIFDRVAFQAYIDSKENAVPHPLPILNPINPAQVLTTVQDFTRHRVTILNDVPAIGPNRNGLRHRGSAGNGSGSGSGNGTTTRRRRFTNWCTNGMCSIQGGSRKRKQRTTKRKNRHSRKH